MSIRRVLVALAVAGALLVIGTAPALAAGPPVPPGCTFDQATGVQTCVTTTTTTVDSGYLNTNGPVEPPATVGGFTVQQICDAVFPEDVGVTWTAMTLDAVQIYQSVTTTTTTEQHGLNGKVFDTSASTSTVIIGANEGIYTSCSYTG